MKRFKGMKLKNKWMILIAGAFFLAVGGFTHTGSLMAAQADEEDTLMTMDYLDPYDLTVTTLSVSRVSSVSSVSSASSVDALISSSALEPTSDSFSLYAQPLKIWIPYRPTFRSPCIPSL